MLSSIFVFCLNCDEETKRKKLEESYTGSNAIDCDCFVTVCSLGTDAKIDNQNEGDREQVTKTKSEDHNQEENKNSEINEETHLNN